MSDDLDLLRGTLAAIFEPPTHGIALNAAPAFDVKAWLDVESMGLTHVTLPAAANGGDGEIEHALLALRMVAAGASPIPLLETRLAGLALHAVGVTVPSGPLTYTRSPLRLSQGEDGWHLAGPLSRVPWGAAADLLVIASQDADGSCRIVQLDPQSITWQTGTNMAGEPRDSANLDLLVGSSAVASCDPALLTELSRQARLGRAAMIVGAAETACQHAIDHVQGRVQFGKPLARYQVVQHTVAAMASITVAAATAVDAAAALTRPGWADATGVEIATLAAKVQANECAALVARSAHQLHGAIGFTDEHALARSTSRLWSWQQEDGTSLWCSEQIGADATIDDPWSLLVGYPL